ncbi:MAG TPA: phytanoyl-CoA dioxygenase family protein [Caulobacteraceae bacterium]|jgi:hypothetical protein|nr:phytanoyl-CoA dioxygenase family protein [Caulobacteraceae bacterium]
MTGLITLAPADWRAALSAADWQALVEEGWLHIPAVADGAALEAMRAAWAARLRAPGSVRRGNNEGPERLDQDPAFRPCLEHPYVMSAVAQVLDGDVNLLGFRGRDPQAGSGQQGFHVDFAEPVAPDRQCVANAFWLLDDMDQANGATRVVPGSHRLARLPSKSLSQPDARHPEARPIPARAGDVIVFSAHLWHAGSRNQSGAPRRIAMAMFGRSELLRAYDERGYLAAL